MLQFALAFDDARSVDAVLATLAQEGVEVELQPQRDSSLVVSAVPVKPVQVTATADRMRQLAAKHGGEYLGHGGLSIIGLVDVNARD